MRLIDMMALKRCSIVESIDSQMARMAMATNKRKEGMAGFKKVSIRKKWLMSNLKQLRLQNLLPENLLQFSLFKLQSL